jgi:hypothetical protein
LLLALHDPKYITITFDDGKLTGKVNTIAALEVDGALARGWNCNDNDDINSMSSC